MPPGFRFPQETDVWLPLTVPGTLGQFEAFRGWMPTTVVARLAPGVTPERAEAAVRTLVRRFSSDQPTAAPPELARVQPLRDVLVGSRRP
jgi:hypothetical protein